MPNPLPAPTITTKFRLKQPITEGETKYPDGMPWCEITTPAGIPVGLVIHHLDKGHAEVVADFAAPPEVKKSKPTAPSA